jgi:hypothetical protein
MRQGQQQNRRGRGRSGSNTSNTSTNTHSSNNNGNRKTQNPLSRTYESSGPDVKIRGTAAQIAEKYMTLSRDASSSSDTVMAENYLQHAEHYNRIIMAAQLANVQNAAPVGVDAGPGQGHGMNGSQQRPHREANHNLRDQPQPHIPAHPGSEPQPVIAGAEKPESKAQPVEKPDFVAAQPAAETDGNVEEQKTADGNDQNEQPRRRRRRYPSAAGGNGSSRASGNGNDEGATERTGQAAIAEAQSPGEATA